MVPVRSPKVQRQKSGVCIQQDQNAIAKVAKSESLSKTIGSKLPFFKVPMAKVATKVQPGMPEAWDARRKDGSPQNS